MLRAWFVPLSSSSNPYQVLLARALERQGIGTNVAMKGSSESGERESRNKDALMGRTQGEIIHVHWLDQLLLGKSSITTLLKAGRFMAKLRSARHHGARVVWTVHNLHSHERRYPGLETLFTKAFLAMCDGIIVHYPRAKQIVSQALSLASGTPVRIVPHGNFLGYYPNDITRSEARKYYGYGDEETVFLCFGKIRPYKEIAKLLSDFSAVPDINARLLIAGSPRQEMRSSIEELARRDERIALDLRHVSDREVQICMNAADAVISPATQPLTSGSAILAMSFGKAVIGPRTPHLEYLMGGNSAHLYDLDEQGALSRMLSRLRRDELLEAGRDNQGRVVEFSWEDAAARTSAMYQEVVAL